MPIPKVPSAPSLGKIAVSMKCEEEADDLSWHTLRQEFHQEMEKVMKRLMLLEEQLLHVAHSDGVCTRSVDVDDNEGNAVHRTEAKPEEVEVLQVGAETENGLNFRQDSDIEQMGLVNFSLSAWTYPMVLGLADAGLGDLIFAVLLMFVNFGMQAAFSIVILGVDFMGEEFTEQVTFAERWRTGFAHDEKYVDLTSRSLVTRVCSGDGSLVLANRQATLIEEINSYMGLANDQFQANWFQPGVLLSTMCILLWALCVFKEWRNIWLTLEGIWKLPRSARTVLRDNRLQSLSKFRLKWLVSTCITRFIIATVLLLAGAQWLARTTSITELMLNAVALNAILDVDEFLFAGFTPLSIQVAIETLEPMQIRHSHRRSQLESLFLFLLLLFTAVFPYVTLLKPLGDTMLEVKWNLCAGNQNFVVGKNTNSQVVAGYETRSSLTDGSTSIMQLAVATHIHQPADQQYGDYITFETIANFDRVRSRSMAQEADQYTFCVETDHLSPGGLLYGDPVLWYSVARPRLRTAAGRFGLYDVETCEAAAELCNQSDAGLLRMVCGRTCGCTDPDRSPFLMVPAQGCSTPCLQSAVFKAASRTCQDAATDERWLELWDGYVPALNHYLGTDISASTTFFTDILNWIAAVKVMGCSAFTYANFSYEVTGRQMWCQGDPNFYRPFALICPVSCGCTAPNPPAYCPSCTAP